MIEVVKTPLNTAESFYRNLSDSEYSLKLCAPYIKQHVIHEILQRKQANTRLTVVTSSNLAVFSTKGSDVSAIRTLLENNVQVFNYQNLHAKIYLFDDRKALITSANLTNGGLYHNYEYGLLLDEEKSVDQIETDFNDMVASEECGEFSIQKLDEIERMLENIQENNHVFLTETGTPLLSKEDVIKVTSHFIGWKKDVLEILLTMENCDFTLMELRLYTQVLELKHPKNNNVNAKVRQVLQQLRDLGLIRFSLRGQYNKLWR